MKLKYIVKHTRAFKKGYKLAKKRGQKVELLKQVVELLAAGEPLPEEYQDMLWLVSGRGSESAMFFQIGCLSTASKRMC